MNGKPDPSIFLLAAERLGCAPAGCVVIEDALVGIEAAHRAGMRVLAVATTNSLETLAAADDTVASMAEASPDRLSKLAGA